MQCVRSCAVVPTQALARAGQSVALRRSSLALPCCDDSYRRAKGRREIASTSVAHLSRQIRFAPLEPWRSLPLQCSYPLDMRLPSLNIPPSGTPWRAKRLGISSRTMKPLLQYPKLALKFHLSKMVPVRRIPYFSGFARLTQSRQSSELTNAILA